MSPTIIIVTGSADTARSLDRDVRAQLPRSVESFFMTYAQRAIHLSGSLYRTADLFVLELMRAYDYGLRAEGIFAAETLHRSGKKAIVVSGSARAPEIRCQSYWDLGSPLRLRDVLEQALASTHAVDGPGLLLLREAFAVYCKPLPDHHRGRPCTEREN